jgi:hypothetical protein
MKVMGIDMSNETFLTCSVCGHKAKNIQEACVHLKAIEAEQRDEGLIASTDPFHWTQRYSIVQEPADHVQNEFKK